MNSFCLFGLVGFDLIVFVFWKFALVFVVVVVARSSVGLSLGSFIMGWIHGCRLLLLFVVFAASCIDRIRSSSCF
jgi:hypothetical protein